MTPRRREPGRRRFLRGVGAGLAAAAVRPAASSAFEVSGAPGLALLTDPADAVASSSPAREAARRLGEACASRGIAFRAVRAPGELRAGELPLWAFGSSSGPARARLDPSVRPALDAPESFALATARESGRYALVAASPDALGLAYALAELADRVECAENPVAALQATDRVVERPACRVRGAMRLFASDVEDLGWFHDRSFWPGYLDMLVGHRFNRFNLALGLGYDFARRLRDTYFYFPYPFLLAVPGYDARASGVSAAERDRNLETLRYVSEQAERRGLHFQLGLWTHAYKWTDSPDVNHTISGLSRETHAAYCRDALTALLQDCPAIRGVTLRTHGESGVPEGDAERYAFWRTLMGGIARAGRPLEIDLHAKGVDERIIDIALETGLRVRVSPKFWAEHMGLPYLQASIRALELPREDRADPLMSLSAGSRNHMRYSYGDLFSEDRRYGILHRVWPGTQRLLLWGDPVYAAGMGRAFAAHGADGVEYMEPLSFKGRKGSGQPGGRDAYRDTALRAEGGDFRKYEYTYRLWGRLAYAPDAPAESWRRRLRRDHGPAAEAVESGLACASRILPLVSAAHCPSAANNNYWPEIYTDMSLVDASRSGSYSDTPEPRVFATVSSLDPQLFASVAECADALERGTALARVLPTEVARQLELWAEAATADLARADALAGGRADARYKRVATDAAIAAGLGRFFAGKLRAAVAFALFERAGDTRARAAALAFYREARSAFAELALGPAQAYVSDVTFGFDAQLRGHWQDRLAAIDRKIAELEGRGASSPSGAPDAAHLELALAAVRRPADRPQVAVEHEPPAGFVPGEPIALSLATRQPVASVRLLSRRLNQAESWKDREMSRDGTTWRGAVAADETRSPYPMQYYFALGTAEGIALWPGFGADFAGQPYVVLRRRA